MRNEDAYFVRFRDALDNDNRPGYAILFADIVGSTEMKSRGELTWLPTMGKFYDVVSDAVGESEGRVVKYLGDGVVAAFNDTVAENAINAAIRIQEQLEELRHENRIICHCSIGISTGKPVEYAGPGGLSDLIGATVDLSARMCSAAAANAVWVDLDTVHSANISRISSKIGKASNRKPADYLSGNESVNLKGLNTVEYNEIIWSNSGFGVRGSVVTDMVEGRTPTNSSEPIDKLNAPSKKLPEERNWQAGQVKRWDPQKGQGFLNASKSNRDYFFLQYACIEGHSLKTGEDVAFLPRPPVREGRNEIAACVAPMGVEMQAKVEGVPEGKNFAFVSIYDRNGNRGLLFTPLQNGQKLTRGESVIIEVNHGRTGPIAQLAENKS